MVIDDDKIVRPQSPAALTMIINNQSKALMTMAKVADRFELQINNLKRIILHRDEQIKVLQEQLETEQEENSELNYTIQTLQKEKEDLEKNVTRN